MGTITVTEFVSMDGVMQAPGGEKFKYEGWTFDFDRGEDGGKFKFEELADAEAQLHRPGHLRELRRRLARARGHGRRDG